MTLISVIIPCFNAGSLLERALASVLSQSHPKVEIIVQDNLSTDSATCEILQKFKNQIRWIQEKDLGIYDAFNRGIQKAHGDWIYLMGADDYLAETQVFEKLISYAFDPKYKVITGDIVNENIQNKWVPQRFHSKFSWRIYWKNSVHQQGALYHKDCFSLDCFNPHYRVLSDYQFHIKLHRSTLKKLESSLIIAHCEATGISKNFNDSLYAEEIKMKKETLPTWLYGLNIPWIGLKRILKSNG
jgi:glycosyltransferase involved in cell wall biosynthesis